MDLEGVLTVPDRMLREVHEGIAEKAGSYLGWGKQDLIAGCEQVMYAAGLSKIVVGSFQLMNYPHRSFHLVQIGWGLTEIMIGAMWIKELEEAVEQVKTPSYHLVRSVFAYLGGGAILGGSWSLTQETMGSQNWDAYFFMMAAGAFTSAFSSSWYLGERRLEK